MLKMKGNVLTTKEGMLMAKDNVEWKVNDQGLWGAMEKTNWSDERQQGMLKVMVGVLEC